MRCLLAIGLAVLLTRCAPVGPDPGAHRLPIFFTEWSASLDHEGLAAVAAAAAEIVRRHPSAPVTVIGYDDPEGSVQENLALSGERAQVVADALVLAGIPARQLKRQAKGATSYAAAALESRRVEIVVNGK